MTHALNFVAAAALLAVAGTASAAVIGFNDPSAQIDIDAGSNVATYAEAGFTISGQAAEYLIIDEALVGGFFGAQPLRFGLADGGLFALLSVGYGYFDLGEPAGELMLTGLRGGITVVTRTLGLGAFASAMFDSDWTMLSEVRFSATSGFTLDNISVVPEPASLALAALGLAALVARRPRRASGPVA